MATKSKNENVMITCEGVLCMKKDLNFRAPMRKSGLECLNCYRSDLAGGRPSEYHHHTPEPSNIPRAL
jgi:hypothetical protein